ncbi:MAG: hypothetical protein KatS3mg110_1583 [Pirellulaceae bacterium]|nr:MAG: hypothetical protein KatS3mg110_1583 [Pirellulaceae bacterium]
MARLAILIPWWNTDTRFEDTLVSILQNRPNDCRVCVVHNQPYDDPWQLAGEVEFLQIEAASEVGLINAGWRAISAPVIHIIRCGYEAVEGWVDEALGYFANPKVASVVPVVLQHAARNLVAFAGVRMENGERHLVATGWPLQRIEAQPWNASGPALSAAFLRRSVLEASGGYDEWLGTAAADADLAVRWSQAGWQTALAANSRLSGPLEDPQLSPVQAARYLSRLYWRYAPCPRWRSHLRGCWRVWQRCRSRSLRHVASELWGSWLGYWDCVKRPIRQNPTAGQAAFGSERTDRALGTGGRLERDDSRHSSPLRRAA